MEKRKTFRDLIAWTKAMDLVDAVYEVTKRFPRGEVFGLTQQMRRAANSVPSNIAEGYGRFSKREFVRFLQIAHGSLYEVETQLLIAQRQGYLSEQEVAPILALSTETGKVIHGLLHSAAK